MISLEFVLISVRGYCYYLWNPLCLQEIFIDRTMLIKQILSGRKRSDFVIIKDTASFDGLSVLKLFINEGVKRNVPVHLVLSEYDMSNFNISPNIIIHKYFPDPWRLLAISDEQKDFESLIDKILSDTLCTGSPALIAIDSIYSVLRYVDLYTFCRGLKKVSETFIREGIPIAQITTILHSALIPEDSKEFKHLSYIATTEIDIKGEFNEALSVFYRQLNGKVQKEIYTCCYGTNKELVLEIRNDPLKLVKEIKNDDRLVQTTFKLSLEENEKASRSQVVLPYIKSGKGRIFYEPDVNDDWDDEDPDDDLEI